MKSSKIKSIDKINPFTRRDGGRTYYFTLTFENGDSGEIGKKSIDAFKVGDSVNYRLEDAESVNGKHYFKIVEERSEGNGRPYGPSGGGEQKPVTSFALAWAKDCVVARIGNGTQMSLAEIKTEVFDLADEFLNWMRLKEAV